MPQKTRSLSERLFRHVDTTGDCWQWTGSLATGGYGTIIGELPDRPRLRAHRVMYELLVGPIPEGMDLDHLCRNRGCVKPSHLEPVTRRENLLRGQTSAARNAAVTHCPYGHPYDAENTYLYPNGRGRACRICRRDAASAHYARTGQHDRVYVTHCPKGHEFNEANTYWRKKYGRACRVCARERAMARNRAAGAKARIFAGGRA